MFLKIYFWKLNCIKFCMAVGYSFINCNFKTELFFGKII